MRIQTLANTEIILNKIIINKQNHIGSVKIEDLVNRRIENSAPMERYLIRLKCDLAPPASGPPVVSL
ncbi:MAG: hypothetical protein Fur0023_22400 [Bacteroidia bacterium]